MQDTRKLSQTEERADTPLPYLVHLDHMLTEGNWAGPSSQALRNALTSSLPFSLSNVVEFKNPKSSYDLTLK